MMNNIRKPSRILGIAFLFQFATSLASGLFLKQALIVPENMHETMLKIAAQPWQIRAIIFLDMLTALGVIFLGCMLFSTLRKQNEKMAQLALGFYILEGALLAASRTEAFSLLRISQEYAITANPTLQIMGQVAYESMDYVGNTLHMLAFSLGAILFYSLLDQSRLVPRALSLWGLITVLPCLVGTLTQIFGYTIPFGFYLPYVPFEITIGVWILVKGIPDASQPAQHRAAARIPIQNTQ